MRWLLNIFLWLALILLSCSDNRDEINCRVTAVILKDGSTTRFSFTSNANGQSQLDLINMYENTDSTYSYRYVFTSNQIASITRMEDGQSTTLTVSYSNNAISKVATTGEETRFEYASDKLMQTKGYVSNSMGTLFQVSHTVYSYDALGNLVKSDVKMDLIAIFSLLFGQDPEGYQPLLLASVVYEPSDAPNPLLGHLFLENLDLMVMKFIPSKITIKDTSGISLQTETYSITKDGNKLPIRVESGQKQMEVVYECR